MATLIELLQAAANDTLKQKVRAACFLAAEKIRVEADNPSKAARMAWARAVFANPEAEGNRMVWAVVAQNSTFALNLITGATDAQVQTAVDNAVNVFI